MARSASMLSCSFELLTFLLLSLLPETHDLKRKIACSSMVAEGAIWEVSREESGAGLYPITVSISLTAPVS